MEKEFDNDLQTEKPFGTRFFKKADDGKKDGAFEDENTLAKQHGHWTPVTQTQSPRGDVDTSWDY